jgi:cell wall-associated NlpC family hydrolase
MRVALAVLAAVAPVPGQQAVVSVPVATLWAEPRYARPLPRTLTTTERRALVGRIETQALLNEPVRVLRVRGAWARIAVLDQPSHKDSRGYPGWVPLAQLAQPFGASDTVTVTVPSVRLLGREISFGTHLPALRRDAASVEVATPWGRATLPAAAAAPLDRESVVATARRLLGTRYLWGGGSAGAYDCSGLVYEVFQVHGIVPPRDADDQFAWPRGRPVASSALRPGDLVFYGRSFVHHVAIYAGGGRMIEAPNSASQVRDVPMRWDDFAGARRYVGA